MDAESVEERQQHKQKASEHFCTFVGLLAEYYAVKDSYVWLAWAGSLFLWFAVRNYARHYLRARWPRLSTAAILASIPLIVVGTYRLTKEPKRSVNTVPTSQAQVQIAVNQAPQNLPAASAPKGKPKSRPPHVNIEQHGAGSGAVGGDLNVAPCSNSAVGGIGIQQTVNCAPPPPTLYVTCRKLKPNESAFDQHWAIGQLSTDTTLRKNPGVLVTFWFDRGSTNARVAARCDQACEGIEATPPGASNIEYGFYDGVTPFIEVATLPRSGRVLWEIRSKTAEEINVAESNIQFVGN